MDVLIKNAKIIDGSGEPSYYGDVGIDRGKIVLQDLPQWIGYYRLRPLQIHIGMQPLKVRPS